MLDISDKELVFLGSDKITGAVVILRTSLLLQKMKIAEASDLSIKKYSERVARRKFAAFASKCHQSNWL